MSFIGALALNLTSGQESSQMDLKILMITSLIQVEFNTVISFCFRNVFLGVQNICFELLFLSLMFLDAEEDNHASQVSAKYVDNLQVGRYSSAGQKKYCMCVM